MISIADGSVHIQTAQRRAVCNPVLVGRSCSDGLSPAKARHPQQDKRARAFPRGGASDATTCWIFWPCSQGYAISGERTLEAFYEAVHPFASTFMALFGRASLPAASTLSRF